MSFPILLTVLPTLFLQINSIPHQSVANNMKNESVYYVEKLKSPTLTIDGDWGKSQWENVPAVLIENKMGADPKFFPKTQAKLMYDEHNIYGIFRVEDQYVLSTIKEINGHVSGDSCVEFFFSPDSLQPEQYFNLEINAGGIPLLFYITHPWDSFIKLKNQDIEQIEIAHSMPESIDPEITDPTNWIIEFRIPLSMLKKFSNVTHPQSGVTWKANFYKTGSLTSNPHYFTWAPVDNPIPNFHLPRFFGTLQFK